MYTINLYIPNDNNKSKIEDLALSTLQGCRTITDNNGNSYNLIDILGVKSKTDSADEFSDWSADDSTTVSVNYTQAYGATKSNPQTLVLYIREAYRDIFKFNADIMPAYLMSSVATGAKTAVSDISSYRWFNVDDTSETAYIKGVLQDNGYEYYFHFDFDYKNITSSSVLYLYMYMGVNTCYLNGNGSNRAYIGVSQYCITDANESYPDISSYLTAIDESGGVTTFTVTMDGENFSSDSASEYESGENVSIVITPVSGYQIDSVSCDDETAVITENGDGTFTVTFAISQDTTISVTTSETGTTTDYLEVVADNTNCTLAYYDENGDEISVDEIPLKSYVKIVATAADGYYFGTVPRLVLYRTLATQTNYSFSVDASNPDGDYPTIYYYEIASTTSDYYIYHVSIYAYGTLKESDFEGFGICSFYKVTKEQLKTISDSRYRTRVFNYAYLFVDTGDYISTLCCIYMDVATNGTETLLLGGYSTGISDAEAIDTLFQNVDCGYFTVDEIFNNAYDYENVAIRAYLPFYGFADLETAKYMNKTTHVYYKVFISTGDSIIFFEDESGNILDTFNCNIGYNIPYIVKNETYDLNSTKINSNLLYGFTPFVEISYNNAVNSIATKGYNDEVVVIGDLGGYVKCNEVFNTIQTTQQERTMIDNLLKSGILI